MDNKSLNRMSVDRPNGSSNAKDRQPPVIPPMPAVNHSFEDPPAVPQHTTGGMLLLPSIDAVVTKSMS